MKVCGKTDVGLRRHENQDTFAVEHGEKLLIAVVCDGMGGAEGGQIASSLAVETFMKEMRALIRADMTAEQLRELARGQLRHGDYSNEQVVGQFAEHFDVLERRLVSQTFPMPADDVLAFARMTPLLFNVDVDSLDLSRIHELTVEAEILVGSVCG